MTGRLVIVSNRLPVSVRRSGEELRLRPSAGGLATGLRSWHEQSGGLWVGWPGDVCPPGAGWNQMAHQLREQGFVPVQLSAEEIDRYYHGFANRVLWPVFHYLIDRVPPDAAGWQAYREVNDAFSEVVASHYQAGDTIWVHDYQLMLLPELLRNRLPQARIGFFLHVPFPSSEVFRTLPWRREILKGLLGADLIGFHTHAYLRHFVGSLLHVDGVELEVDRLNLGDRESRLGTFPMGIDAARFAQLAQQRDVREEADAIRRDAGGRRILLGIDRLDYTKGIPRRLQAVKRLLTADPGLADRMRYIQVAVPSREGVDTYRQFRRELEESVGQINGAFGTLRSAPIHYVHRPVSMRQLVALYCAADVMLVTPLRDGMNLVAKEFVASRTDGDGVLVLSEFAGAAAELDGALVVNPYDIDAIAASIQRALAMTPAERQGRMRTLRQRVLAHDVHSWAKKFLDDLETARPPARIPDGLAPPEPALFTALVEARAAGPLRLLVDYDGTLVPIARSPAFAAPDDELLVMLANLAAQPGITVEIVSGRPREILDAWFGALPVALWAEHGFWHRRAAEQVWQPAATLPAQWPNRILPILEEFTTATPGSQIEMKSASIAWHYRGANREFAARQAHELRMLLGDALSNQPLEVFEGRKVIEIRLRGVSKARAAHTSSNEEVLATTVAIGDDYTDEELFRALPPSSLTVAVGRRATSAKYRVDDYRAVRQLLRSLTPVGLGLSA